MTVVFVAGSRNIRNLAPEVLERLDKVLSSNFKIVVGDASGSDTSIQSYLSSRCAKNVEVYCSGSQPRNNVGQWPTICISTDFAPGTRAFFTAKDKEMAAVADYGLMVWDSKSTGTLSNVIELLRQKKKALVFINKAKEFKVVSNVEGFEGLLAFMSAHSIRKADDKIKLMESVKQLRHEQYDMFG